MGLFRSKGKANSDHVDAVDPPTNYSRPTATSGLQNDNDMNYTHNSLSSVPPSHFNDSGYSGSYTNSNVSSNMSSADTRASQKPTKVTTVTTTTTTTTTTTVDSDGSTHTQVQPYDPATDPPPASEITIASTAPPNGNSTSNPAEYTTVRRNSTSGGRTIPPRSELRNSQNAYPQSQPQNTSEYQAEHQSQSQYQPAPLNTRRPDVPTPLSPTAPSNINSYYTDQPGASPNSSYYPPGHTPLNTNNNNNNIPNATYPPSSPPQTLQPPQPVPQQQQQPHHSKRENLLSGIRAIHGASEALRGTVNAQVASRMGDEQDAISQRLVREQGLRELRETGVMRGDRVAKGKLRKRSLSRGLEAERRPLESVDERGVNF